MKMIHCADLHLDSKMDANLSSEAARVRRAEILQTYQDMVEYAKKHEIGTILIAGDLFDKKNISAAAKTTVKNSITQNPEITFYYLQGNHDIENFLDPGDVPENLKLFSDAWTYYEQDGVVIAGVTFTKNNHGMLWNSLTLDRSKVNIVMLHGQTAEVDGKPGDEIVNLKALKNLGIDYLALGHIHSYRKEALDARGVYCYPGCLEGRGFDECGVHGFVVLDIDTKTGSVSTEFVETGRRRLYEVHADISDCMNTDEIKPRVREALADAGCTKADLVKLVLTGEVDVECEIEPEAVLAAFSDVYFFMKVQDRTSLKIDPAMYVGDVSLKGEFVRQVLAAPDLDDEAKNRAIRYGIRALQNEEI